MVDVVCRKKRTQMMSGIRATNTKPELAIRSLLHKRGFRYRLHERRLPGKPDLVFPKYKAVIEIYGCFWHGHDCHLFKWPQTRKDFWEEKISGNKTRDARNLDKLHEQGWKTLVVWECALKGKEKLPPDELARKIEVWLIKGSVNAEISGHPRKH